MTLDIRALSNSLIALILRIVLVKHLPSNIFIIFNFFKFSISLQVSKSIKLINSGVTNHPLYFSCSDNRNDLKIHHLQF